jgi:hypothetical protein
MLRPLRGHAVATFLFVAFALLGAPPIAAAGPALNIPLPKTCKPFMGVRWVNPYPPNERGDHYQVVITGSAFTCTSADAYVKQFVREKIKSTQKSGLPNGPVQGGPAGYVCTSAIGKTATAFQGRCVQKHATAGSPLFSWGPYNDS